jgi:hypothetical protein
MDEQLQLFNVNEAKFACETRWRELPDEARTRLRDLFAGLAIKHLQSITERNGHNERQRENQTDTPEP